LNVTLARKLIGNYVALHIAPQADPQTTKERGRSSGQEQQAGAVLNVLLITAPAPD
jgi:hypothetical protein